MVIIAGIDYSITSPGICVHSGEDEWNYNNCEFFFFDKRKQKNWNKIPKQFHRSSYPAYKSDMERYESLYAWSKECVNEAILIGLEGYSMGSKGKVFNLAENTGILKYNFWKTNIPMNIYPPTEIKKFATGKGNANKEKMLDEFNKENNIDLKEVLHMESKTGPWADIVDSYFICKYTFKNYRENL